jgi:hypothetical protein
MGSACVIHEEGASPGCEAVPNVESERKVSGSLLYDIVAELPSSWHRSLAHQRQPI